jgi:hypothetical protein
MITNYIRQRKRAAEEALRQPLVCQRPKSDANTQTQNVTQLKDYMVRLTYWQKVEHVIPLQNQLVVHCTEDDNEKSLLIVYNTTKEVQEWIARRQQRVFDERISAITASGSFIYAISRSGFIY